MPRLASYGTLAGGHWGGLRDELVRVPWARHNVTPLPPSVEPFLAASAADNLTDAFQAVRPTLAAHPDAEVLVVGGTASLGLLTVLSAIALGAANVTYLDIDERRCAKAAAAGATVAATYPDRLDGDFDLVVDASAATAGLRRAPCCPPGPAARASSGPSTSARCVCRTSPCTERASTSSSAHPTPARTSPTC